MCSRSVWHFKTLWMSAVRYLLMSKQIWSATWMLRETLSFSHNNNPDIHGARKHAVRYRTGRRASHACAHSDLDTLCSNGAVHLRFRDDSDCQVAQALHRLCHRISCPARVSATTPAGQGRQDGLRFGAAHGAGIRQELRNAQRHQLAAGEAVKAASQRCECSGAVGCPFEPKGMVSRWHLLETRCQMWLKRRKLSGRTLFIYRVDQNWMLTPA